MSKNLNPKNAKLAKGNGLASFLEANPKVLAVDIAKHLGTSQGFISQVRNGKRVLPIGNALKLEILYGIDAADLNNEVAEIRQLKPISKCDVSVCLNDELPT